MDQLHFLQPLCLLALLPLALLWWFTARSKMSSSKTWEKVIDAKLLPLLLNGSDEKHGQSESLAKWGLALIWFIATIALADPVWEKILRPIFQTNSARVIVLDLSNSMQIDDLKPSRIARARFKIEDILSGNTGKLGKKNEEGQIGLVLFAGDAFTASPLTRDSETIRALLQVLNPDIMPSQGSRVDLGLKKAHELLKQAGVNNGQVLLVADGVSDQDLTLKAAKELHKDGHKLSVLGVGTELGGVLPQIKYQNGDRITVALDSEFLQEIAKVGGGKYHLLSTNNSDLKSVLSTSIGNANKPEKQNEDTKSEDWKSTGPLIILLLLPFAALAFRRGWLFNIIIISSFIGLLQPQPVLASPLTDSLSEGWNNLWINKEQQADIALNKQQYDKAKKLSKNPLIQGTASYKKEDFTKALEEFKQADSADARYNEGNALANLEKYEEAISAYDEALKQQPNMEDAKKNKSAVRKLLKKKQEQKKDSNKDSKKDDKKKGDKKDSKNGDSKDNKSKDGDGKKSDKQDKQSKDGKKAKDGKQSKNQFDDANKDLKKPKSKAEEKSKKAKDEQGKDKQKEKDSKNKKSDDKKQLENNKIDNIKEKKGTKSEAEELSKEEKMAAEQWLRRIPDDPGGLLRRKFKHQYQQRRRSINDTKQPW
jgi:Ca-activated chloride channel family protein